MKIRVIKRFNDKTADLVTREVNDELDVTPQRAKELITKGFAEKTTEPKPKKTKE